jgi:hypothetical protein
MNADSTTLVVVGGMTTSCGSDATVHELDLASGKWEHASPSSFVRRRGAGAVFEDGTAGSEGVLVIGGIADTYSCGTSFVTNSGCA